MGRKHLQQSFAGGELSPSMYGRLDDQKYQQGLATCRNFVCLPQGPVQNRAGFAFVGEVKDSSKPPRLIPFVFSSSDTMVLEFGEKYVRVITRGGFVPKAAGSSEKLVITTPYTAADVKSLHYAQSGDVLTLVHPNYPPKELRRYGAYDWRLVDVDFAAPLPAPAGLSGSYYCGDENAKDAEKKAYTIRYRVTALKSSDEGDKEGPASSTLEVVGNVYLSSSRVSITWNAVTGAERYRVYKTYSGVYGYIGETEGTSFVDNNIGADTSVTPPRYEAPFSEGDYPGAVSYFEQRRIFAGTDKRPQFVWMTRPGTESDMHYTLPSQKDNRIKFRIAALQASRIRHIVPLSSLILMTTGAEFRVTTANDDTLTPSSVGVKPQSYVGASNVSPVLVNSSIVYAAERGGHMWELGYNWQASGFVTGDMCLRAAHLFDTKEVQDIALAKAPYPIIWCVSSDGTLLGCTYVPEQGVGAWHRHDTKDGAFESVACVAEGDEDILYAVIRRTVNGKTVRYIERMHEREGLPLEKSFFVDAGVEDNYATPQSFTAGLQHLEGETVSILADGKVMPPTVVKNGRVDFPDKATHVIVGLPIEADIKTLPVALQTQDGGYAQGANKNVTREYIRVYRSSGIKVGATFENLYLVKPRTFEPYGLPPALKSEELEVMLGPKWADSGAVCIRQDNPLPLMICGLTSDIAL